jgi:alpha-tubulin suppressor-like RCC1 family protein
VSVRAVEAGGDATCGLTDAGRLLCWGGNGPGTLGLPRSGDKRTPSRFMPGRAFSAAAAGSQSTCGISGGELWCAGTNAWLEDGDSSGLSFWSQTPVRIGAARDWRSVSAGERHLCGIRGTGASARGYCWGWNDHGELGYDGAASVDPVQIGSVGEWEALSAAGDHVCGIRREDGALHCWGYAGSGELGDGGTTSRSTPAPVAGGGAWTAVHGVYASRCAVRSDGTLHCWGDNLAGQLGVGDTTARWEPTQVGTLDGWTRSATGYYHSCGIRDGAMFCWGANGWGALGTDGGSSDVPVPVAAGTAFQEVAAGGMHTCAISDGRMFCWGTNRHGEAGDGSTVADARLPARVGEASDWTGVAAGRMHSCGLRAGGSLWCWGWNGSGQLGDGTAWYPSPVAVRIPP